MSHAPGQVIDLFPDCMRFAVSSTVVLALFALAMPVAAAHAQYTEARVGERIRFEAPGVFTGRHTGTVLRRTTDSLLVGSPDAPPVGVALARIARLDVSRGRSAGAGAKRGLLIGAGVGGVAGLVYTIELLSEESGPRDLAILILPLAVVTEAALGGAVGSAIGAIVKREVWESYTATDTRIGIRVRHGAIRLGLHRAF